MIQELEKFFIPIFLIIAGVMLKKDLFPNTKNTGKLWLLLIIVGCIGVVSDLALLIIRN